MARGIVTGSGNRTVIHFPAQEELDEIFGPGAELTVHATLPAPDQKYQLELSSGREVEAEFSLGRTAQEVQAEALGGPVESPNQRLPNTPNRGLEEASRNASRGGATDQLPGRPQQQQAENPKK